MHFWGIKIMHNTSGKRGVGVATVSPMDTWRRDVVNHVEVTYHFLSIFDLISPQKSQDNVTECHMGEGAEIS